MTNEETGKPNNFIRNIIDADIASGKHGGRVATRFPPEPNGYLHIGHAKSICLNFGIAEDYKGTCNLRFDDTNPHKENVEFVEAIKKDVHWLGYDWGDRLFYASDYFERLYAYAVELIKKDKAYVCDLSPEQTREYRGTLTEPGKDSPFRTRSVEENLDLFARMRAGEFRDGEKILRAKIDMASSNMNLRDPAIYRIRHGVLHHQTGEAWCIYPMYDFTHCLSDAIEGITHSLCTLEFEDHRPLYDWFLDTLDVEHHPRQIEFSRLELEYTITSKRKLTQLVDEGHVEGWDDPRMPTLAGMRRRGYTPASIRDFCDRIGVTKSTNNVEMSVLENCVREDLNPCAPRRMAVLHPLKVVLENYPEAQCETLQAANHPQDESMGVRDLPFTRELYIDHEDFLEVAPNKKFKRLVTGGEVRLRNAYVIRCDEVIKDGDGEIIELRCSYDPDTLSKNPEGRKVKGVIHWVSAPHAVAAEIRLYDRLFNQPNPGSDREGGDFTDHLNPESLLTLTRCYLEPNLKQAVPGAFFQFEREGYFCADPDQSHGLPVFNRTVTLRDSWAKIEKKGG
ncbi:glutaminyl-tRNA synthetase [Thiogranum longum]|uniref:Glutamine--tRNA ligase n=1 Tax=Thiogranum longum TaxID=1537524 RepID=A0A4R1HBR5_9GAMM|nr:glutamine--tRNA ligase/YqeY domain fusion protein [Thiogranum longum]TCK17973.1 glutaminyl-tRNA synthetase [Thiogranum longum]